MKKFFLSLCLALSSLTLLVTDAQAARLGGSKSMGMQRNTSAVQQGSTAARPAPSPAANPATPAQPPKRNWLGPLAGLAAGLGIAALLSHFGLGEAVGNFLMIVLLGIAALFIIRMLMRRKEAPADSNTLQYAGGNPSPYQNPQALQPALGSNLSGNAGAQDMQFVPNLPAGFDAEAFERSAKVNFLRLQAANDKGDLNDLREFTTPEMFAEIRLDIDARKGATQQTDVVSLEAQVLEVVTEGNRHIASVRFSGLIRESVQAGAEPFNEVWNLVKPVEGNQGWLIAGIQQA